MKSYILEYVQNILAYAPPWEEIRAELEGATPKFVESFLGVLAMAVLFYLAVRLRKGHAAREDGWFYLTPGFLSWFVVVSASLVSLGTFLGGAYALRIGYYTPTFDREGWTEIGMFAFFILGFGAVARVCYVLFFRHKIRWSHAVIEKLNGRRMTTRIPWKDVQEVRQKAGADHLWIISKTDRIKVWTHMNGVEQLISAIDGDEVAYGLPRQIKPTFEAKPRPDHAGSFHPDHR